MTLRQLFLTPAAGKRLIGRTLAMSERVQRVMEKGTLVVIAGSTNGYVAEEILKKLGREGDFAKDRFFRGVTLPPNIEVGDTGRLKDESGFPGDLIVQRGEVIFGSTIFDVVDDLKKGDMILKGANAFDPVRDEAAILIGHPKGGTIAAALQAVVGRRVQLVLPVGLEKRVHGDIRKTANLLNAPGAHGARLLPVPGDVYTEVDAIRSVADVEVELVAAGGVGGAEGGIWLAVSGEAEQTDVAISFIDEIKNEPLFQL